MNTVADPSSIARPLYGHADLRRLIDPRSIAVVGASETPGSFGARTLDNIRVGFQGTILPVNPGYQTLAGLPCHPSLAALPEPPDCVVVLVPGAQVEAIVDTAARMGVGGVIIHSAGFAEVGRPEAIDTQRRIVARARAAGVRLLGPNCVGIVNLVSRIGLTFMPKFNEMPMRQGPIGLISQSGALGYCVLQAMARGIGFSHYLSPGNSCDVDACDLINYLVDDPATRVIACMFEGIGDGRRLMQAARRALEADKPLLIYKLANDDVGRRAAMSHTGTIAGSREAYRAAFEKTGVIPVDSWEDLLECAGFFARAGHPRADGVGIMASSGGAAIMGADKAAEFRVPLPAPVEETARTLASVIPDFGSTANPCDLTAESLKSAQMYGRCIRAFAEDPGFAAIVVPMMSAHRPATVERAEALSALAAGLDKPICVVWLNEWLEGPGSEVYDASPSIAMFRSMGRCMKALRLWLDHHRRREGLLGDAAGAIDDAVPDRAGTIDSVAAGRGRAADGAAADAARELVAKVSQTLSESRSKSVLACFGIPVTRERLCATPAEAAHAARKIGLPVALKIDSPDIPHKTEAGVVRLALDTPEAVERAAGELLAVARRLPGRPAIGGGLVQQMAAPGAEMMIGARRDPQFGPLVLCGFGGVDVEVDPDVAVALAPVSRPQAEAMIRSLRKARLLQGHRGRPALDIDALADAIVRVSELAWQLRDRISEIDVNPFIVGTRGGIAADALIVTDTGLQQA
ncbi:MAG TPA: acetate--CoA ligase family protein [Burkholderiaceae bacterium]|nr:acetate--CoA ligase family protein [Burkholderiaceae bacterium]